MKALFVPDYSLQNPYQWLLARGLAEEGVDVVLSDGIGRLPLLGAMNAYGKPDVVHLHWTHPFVLRAGPARTFAAAALFSCQLIAAKAVGVRLVWTVHNLADHDGEHPRIERLFQRLLASLADALIVHAPFARKAVVRHLALPARAQRRIRVIPHGHYLDAYDQGTTRTEARAQFGFGERDKVLLYFGQLRPYRGAEQLLDAFASVDSADARLLMAGRITDEALRRRLDDQAGSDRRVTLHYGFVPSEAVQRYFLAADAVVLPYVHILTSGSAMLALTFGRPVVAPRLGCLPDVLDGSGAVFYEPESPGALALALERVLLLDGGAMGDHNKEKAASFGWDAIAAATREAYSGAGRPSGVRSDRPEPTLSTDPWAHRLRLARRELDGVLGPGSPITLADSGELSYDFSADRPVTPFPHRDGLYWGPPADDAAACKELDALVSAGSRYLVVAWPAFWWLEEYPRFRRHLARSARCLLRNDRLVVFELRRKLSHAA